MTYNVFGRSLNPTLLLANYSEVRAGSHFALYTIVDLMTLIMTF